MIAYEEVEKNSFTVYNGSHIGRHTYSMWAENVMEGVTPTVEPTDDIWAAYDETVTLTTALAEDTAITFYEGEDWEKNAWYDAYLDRFNIQVKNLWISSDYSTIV